MTAAEQHGTSQSTESGPPVFDPNAETCPNCGVRWWTEPIPESHWTNGWQHGYPTHFSNLAGIYDRDRDRTVAWMCPACRKEWPR